MSSKNNWSHEWKNLDKDAAYRVTELQVPEGYKMSVENVENRYTITNTYVKKRKILRRERILRGAEGQKPEIQKQALSGA